MDISLFADVCVSIINPIMRQMYQPIVILIAPGLHMKYTI